MITSTKKSVQILVQLCLEKGLKHLVVSPGSRNAPLIIAFNQHPEIQCIVIPDERSAAFVALGLAQQTKSLVGIICTSGSAPLNYYPAISEAYYQGIPLLVLTADRPQAWVNQGDGQTIVQHEVFKNHIRYSCTLSENESDESIWFTQREISTSLEIATEEFPGPVHVNIPFSEPLYGQVELSERLNIQPIHAVRTDKRLSAPDRNFVQNSWKKTAKKWILCGQMSPNPSLVQQLKVLAQDPSVVVFVENTSNLFDESFIHCIDRTLNCINESELENFAPDLLVSIGGAIVSKRIKTFLRKYKAKQHWKVGFDFPFMDTYQNLTHSFSMRETSFFSELVQTPFEGESDFGTRWKEKDYLVQEEAKRFFENEVPYSDLLVFHTILDYVPENSQVQLANSSVVRYAQLFDPIRSVNYWCNRGTSGIDGSSSTALGAALAKPDDWCTLISGDLSFFYDSNAFWNLQKTPNLRVFLINNGGGGIFKIIPGPDTTQELNDFFVFKNQFEAEYICKTFGLGYFKATSVEEIESQQEAFFTYDENGHAKVMEIFTDGQVNDLVLKSYFEAIKL